MAISTLASKTRLDLVRTLLHCSENTKTIPSRDLHAIAKHHEVALKDVFELAGHLNCHFEPREAIETSKPPRRFRAGPFFQVLLNPHGHQKQLAIKDGFLLSYGSAYEPDAHGVAQIPVIEMTLRQNPDERVFESIGVPGQWRNKNPNPTRYAYAPSLHAYVRRAAPISDLTPAHSIADKEGLGIDAFLRQYAPAYRDSSCPLFPHIPVVNIPTGETPENPDPRVFVRSPDGAHWYNDTPDPQYYTYSAARDAYVRTTATRPEDEYFQKVVPRLAAITADFDSEIELRIDLLEHEIRDFIARRSLGWMPAFALRGISCSHLSDDATRPESLGAWALRGYLSAGGGNFFVYGSATPSIAGPFAGPKNTQDKVRTAAQFLQRLMASVGSAFRYAGRSLHPVVILADLDNRWSIPPSGGNDGITGAFPLTLHLDEDVFQLPNMEVGCITRPDNKGPVTGMVAQGIPESHLRKRIGADGLPAWASHATTLNERPHNEEIALSRWFYKEVLEALVAKLDSGDGLKFDPDNL